MADTFVTTICDFHYNYYACSNKETLAMLDIIFISIQVSNLICPFLYYVIRKIRKATSTPIDALALINVISRSLNVLYLFRLRQVLWLGPEDMLSYTRGNIFTEWIIMTISGIYI